ncbi:MAG: DMT family transporter [Rhodobacteraceae bacterium]|nr:DMT family transporter [Paracoccaceae bacterium]MBR9823873.1 DMT family transporter [Paracoccaceae bacterium]
MTDNFKAALLMMGSLALLSFNDTAIKAVAMTIPLAQIIVLRNAITSTALAFVLSRTQGAFAIARRDWILILLRGVGEAGAAYFYLEALVHMPFANLVAILQSAPFVVTLAAALFLGESVGWRRISAILVGFVGVLLILRPGTEGFDIYSIYVLISVLFITLRDLTTRRLSPEVSSMTVTFITSTMVMLTYVAIGLGTPWVPMPGWTLWLTVAAAALVLTSYVSIIQAMRMGEISFVSPFRYTSLLFALVLGLVFFGEWPEPLTLIGAAIVVASGLFMLYREHKLGVTPGAPEELPEVSTRP